MLASCCFALVEVRVQRLFMHEIGFGNAPPTFKFRARSCLLTYSRLVDLLFSAADIVQQSLSLLGPLPGNQATRSFE